MPETRSATEIMRDHAAEHGCDFKPFSQGTVIGTTPIGTGEGSHGICFGLAMAWLEAIKNGQDAGFLDANRQWTRNQAFARSHLIWTNLNQPKVWQKLIGLTPAIGEDEKGKREYFSIEDQGMLEFAHWLRGAIGTRYFLIKVKKHTMAAAGSSTGWLKFFDPNGGVVSTMYASKLANFLGAYLCNEKLRAAYFPYLAGYSIGVEKYKKG